MCTRKPTSLPRLLCALSLLVGIILPSGLGQNAEPRGFHGSRNPARKADFLRDEFRSDEVDEGYNWDAAPEGRKELDEKRRALSSRAAAEAPETEAEVAPQADGNRNKALLPQEGAANFSASRALNAATSSSGRRKGSGGDRGRKKRRKNKNTTDVDHPYENAEDARENEIRGKRGRGAEKRTGGASRKAKDSQARKSRIERRRRRKNRERKRGRKRARQEDERRRSSKFKRRMNDAPAALLLGKLGEEADSKRPTEAPSNLASNSTAPPNLQEQLTTEFGRGMSHTTPRYGSYADTVEREFSKQLEKEISKTRIEDPSSLEDRILGSSLRKSVYGDSNRSAFKDLTSRAAEDRSRIGGPRYDAEKMLGYSRTEEDLPILDLENEVLARTLKDYNAYMTSSLKFATAQRQEEEEAGRRKPAGPRFHGKPIIEAPERSGSYASGGDADVRVPSTTSTYGEDNTKGDLSCINGTFLPAPLSRHALIKYVKSSIPGHEYLEADYECAPGFYMASIASRLLCKERQWIGQVPRCKIKQNSESACAEASCEHVCKEMEGKAVCTCYKGFRLDGNKCVDINECLLNNGHGPCQDTCRNTVGGYECSCEGLQDTVLSPDNHTCQDAGPCSVNNAGCSHTCLSTMGRVFCLCPDGFMLEDDWKTCQDVDECAVPDLQTEVCRYGCINTPGSYRCAEPMELKDQPVLDSLSITCLPGYEATPDGTCIDINECTVDNGACTEVCENTDGSFFCACNGDERALSSDGKSCVDINNVACPPLNPAGRGYLMCSRLTTPKPWRGRRRVTNRPGTKCFLKCPHGYQLRGEYELTCRSDGTWDGPKHGECVRYSKPRLECPKDVVAELPPGRDEAFVTFDQPATDLDWFRYVRSKPSWGTRLEANLKPGVHEVSFYARHPVSKKQTSCVLRIIVKGGEAPKVKDCPNDIEVTGNNGTAITWVEPIFTDNVKVTRIRSNESPGRRFDVGGHRIEYEASDEAGWSSKCVFTVVLRQE
ncbi:hypothetical protein KM043_005438 [Ampulex compressa]|nr:hypothetical protein KM043_005438 [Ampulex compressa]